MSADGSDVPDSVYDDIDEPAPDDGGGGGGGGGDGLSVSDVISSLSPSDIGLGWIQNRRNQIIGLITASVGGITFWQNPQGFILATIFDTLVGYVLTVTTLLTNAVLSLFWGPGESLGLAEIPGYLAGVLVDAGGAIGAPILGLVEDINAAIVSVAVDAGIAAPLALGALQTGEIILGLFVAERVGRAILSVIPPLEAIIPGS